MEIIVEDGQSITIKMASAADRISFLRREGLMTVKEDVKNRYGENKTLRFKVVNMRD